MIQNYFENYCSFSRLHVPPFGTRCVKSVSVCLWCLSAWEFLTVPRGDKTVQPPSAKSHPTYTAQAPTLENQTPSAKVRLLKYGVSNIVGNHFQNWICTLQLIYFSTWGEVLNKGGAPGEAPNKVFQVWMVMLYIIIFTKRKNGPNRSKRVWVSYF